MANLARTDFTVDRVWYEGDKTGKDILKCLAVTITTGTAGAATNKIEATAFGLSEVWEVIVRGVNNVDPGNYWYIPSYDGTLIYAINLEQATDANRGDPADVAFATFPTKLIVKGIE